MHINHVDGNPKNNKDSNLETVCHECHMIMHSGLWCKVHGVIKLYAKSKYSQNDIISITRKMRKQGKNDDAIIDYLDLMKPIPWKQDLKYLSNVYGFITSKKLIRISPKPYITDAEQRYRLSHRDKW